MQIIWKTERMMKVVEAPNPPVMMGKKKAIAIFKIHIKILATEVPWSTSSAGKS